MVYDCIFFQANQYEDDFNKKKEKVSTCTDIQISHVKSMHTIKEKRVTNYQKIEDEKIVIHKRWSTRSWLCNIKGFLIKLVLSR